ncbi:MAG: 2-oxo acid dehydrogenase subunit E2 [Saprospiraceae bacterium]|nr:2-oxo acid dehydrogenase subunit E2 [Saprospiraceae bacterium]
MAEVIRMPRLSDTMKVGVIRTWHKKVGDKLLPGDVLAEVETDKATMDLEAFQEGTLLYIAIQEGQVEVDGIIAIIGKEGEDYQSLLNEKLEIKPGSSESTKLSEITLPSNESISIPATTSLSESSRIKASPLAKSIAKEKGIDLSTISGTGESGRIIKRDIKESLILSSQKITTSRIVPSSVSSGDSEVLVSQMRQTIANRLSESKFSAPHFYLTVEVDMDATVDARNQINKISASKISFNDIIIKASSVALKSNPGVNVSWYETKMIYHNDVHIGVAVAIEDGLVVPVIRNSDQKSLSQINTEVADKATRAKNRKLSLDEMQGNTFTISNLGMFDIEEFTAIINPPDSCILAVGSILKKPAVKNDQIVISNRMKLTLSCDHRAVDGATGAKFLQTLKGLLEQPISLLL